MKKQIIRFIFNIIFLMLNAVVIAYAEPIVAEGAVPNETSKQAILNKMYMLFTVQVK